MNYIEEFRTKFRNKFIDGKSYEEAEIFMVEVDRRARESERRETITTIIERLETHGIAYLTTLKGLTNLTPLL